MNPQVTGLRHVLFLVAGLIDLPCSVAQSQSCSSSVSVLSSSEVLAWIDSLGKAFQPYRTKFEDNGINGELLLQLDEEDLRGEEFGIQNKQHIKRILQSRESAWESTCRARTLDFIQIPKVEKIELAEPVAEQVLNLLTNSSVSIDDFTRLIASELDGVLSDIVQETVRLEAVERLLHLVIDGSTLVPSAELPAEQGRQRAESAVVVHKSVFEEAKRNLWKILDAKAATRAGFSTIQSQTQDLGSAIRDFIAVQKLDSMQKQEQASKLQKAFLEWRWLMLKTAATAKEVGSSLSEVAKEMLQTMQNGAHAVKENIQALSAIESQLRDARAKSASILGSNDPMVQRAIAARSGALQASIKSAEEDITHLKAEIVHINQILQSKDYLIQKVEKFVVDANIQKKTWRDVNIQRWWASRWGPEMETYDRQADTNIDAQNKEKDRIEIAKELLGRKVKESEQSLEGKLADLTAMQVAERLWQGLLKAEGLFLAEEEAEDAMERFRSATGALQRAMEETGVADAEYAARVLCMQHTSQFLLSNAASKAGDVAQRVSSFLLKFDAIVADLNDIGYLENNWSLLVDKLRLVAKMISLVGNAHARRMQLLDDGQNRCKAMEDYIKRELGERHPGSVCGRLQRQQLGT